MLEFLSPIFKRVTNPSSNSEHSATIEAIMKSLQTLDEYTAMMKLELSISTASGKWLDEWGSWFGVTRNYETDVAYRARIIESLSMLRNTIPAIQSVVQKIVGENTRVDVFEPYTTVFRSSISELSGDHLVQDYDYSRSAVIDIQIHGSIPEGISEIVSKIKSAGVRVYFTGIINFLGEDGSLLRMYVDTEPKEVYTHEVQIRTFENQVYTHTIGESLPDDDETMLSGSQSEWSDQYVDFYFGIISAKRTAAHSRTITYTAENENERLALLDEYFNSLSFEKDTFLGKVIRIGEILVCSDNKTGVDTKTLTGREVFADSVIPLEDYFNQNVEGLYKNAKERHHSVETKAINLSILTGSMRRISDLSDVKISDASSRTLNFNLIAIETESI